MARQSRRGNDGRASNADDEGALLETNGQGVEGEQAGSTAPPTQQDGGEGAFHGHEVRAYDPGSFEPQNHYYPRVLNALIHPMVRYFFGLGNERIAERYCHLHPEVEPEAVHEILGRELRHFRWGGSDCFHVTNDRGVRRIVVIETNSSPSGQKSTPLLHEGQEQGGYRLLLEQAFLPALKRRGLPQGGVAVLWDKNSMEVQGYAAVAAEMLGERVWLVPFFDGDPDPPARFRDGVLEIREPQGAWLPMRGALRYVTQRPWNRIPPMCRTLLMNPVVVCLAGGRNKMLAAKAYDLYNAELEHAGLTIRTPETIWDVGKREVPLWVERMGGVAVVKVPYANAGQGVYTITCKEELEAFTAEEHRYDRFIVQALVGNIGWSSRSRTGKLYHVGTVPDRHRDIYVADLRMMIGSGPGGFFPVALYARRARQPLAAALQETQDSWSMLGTNLSVKLGHGNWDTEPERLVLMDTRDFNRLGLGFDDLVEAYLQTVLAVNAIDRMAESLINSRGRFRRRFFDSINPDEGLRDEIMA